MTKSASGRLSAAKRKAESLLGPRPEPQDVLKQERQVAYDAMVAKTERLRALRLAKEAAEREAAPREAASVSVPRKKVRRSKQT